MKPPTAISTKSVGRQLEILVLQRDEAWARFYDSLDSPMVAREWRVDLMEGWIRLHDAVEALRGTGRVSDRPEQEKEEAA